MAHLASGMKVLVTGGRGQLTRSLVDRAAHFPEVEILTVSRPEVDLEVPGSIARAIAAANPAVVVNCAAYTAVDRAEDEPERALRINAEAAGEIALAAASTGAAVIQVSTDYVFAGAGGSPLDESAATNPLNVYGRSKLAGEDHVRAANPRHLIVRTAWLFSPYRANFVRSIFKLARSQDEIAIVSDRRGSPSSAHDVADGLLTAVRAWQSKPGAGMGETYHLAGSGDATWYDLGVAVAEQGARHGLPRTRVLPIPSSARPAEAERPRDTRLDSSKFRRQFGFTMPRWRDSLPAVVAALCVDNST